MTQIVLTDEQASILAKALKPLRVVDARGNCLGTFTPLWTEEDIAEAKRRLAANEKWYTAAEVLAYLHSLEKHGPDEIGK